MNRYIISGVGGSILSTLAGLQWYWGAIAGLLLAIVMTPQTGNKRVIIENVQTGEIKIQPNDRATQRYISGRGE